jgi:hypothetical protein
MSDASTHHTDSAFITALRQRSATRILELGAVDSTFLLEIIRSADWAAEIELHCTLDADNELDDGLIAAAEQTKTEFKLIKHIGSETDVNDVIMELAANSLPFDGIFISDAASNEVLLTSLLVCNESLGDKGVLGISHDLGANSSMAIAIDSFKDMLGDAYTESAGYVFIKV